VDLEKWLDSDSEEDKKGKSKKKKKSSKVRCPELMVVSVLICDYICYMRVTNVEGGI
jgi:hypothetical protein